METLREKMLIDNIAVDAQETIIRVKRIEWYVFIMFMGITGWVLGTITFILFY